MPRWSAGDRTGTTLDPPAVLGEDAPMRRSYALLLTVALAVLAADVVTKYLAVSRLTTALEGREGLDRVGAFFTETGLERQATRAYPVLEQHWHHRYAENPGAAWGVFRGLPENWRKPFFAVVTLLALGLMGAMYRQLEPSQRAARFALALVIGGALGNFLDRLVRGYVIDFIDWHWRNQPGMRWPTFNVADVAISVGVVLMIAVPLLQGRVSRDPDPPTSQPVMQK